MSVFDCSCGLKFFTCWKCWVKFVGFVIAGVLIMTVIFGLVMEVRDWCGRPQTVRELHRSMTPESVRFLQTGNWYTDGKPCECSPCAQARERRE